MDIDNMNEEELRRELLRCKRIIAVWKAKENEEEDDEIEIEDYKEDFMHDDSFQKMFDEAYEEGWSDAVEYFKFDRDPGRPFVDDID